MTAAAKHTPTMTPAEQDIALVDKLIAKVVARECVLAANGQSEAGQAEYARADAEVKHCVRNLLAVMQARREHGQTLSERMRESAALIAKGRALERRDGDVPTTQREVRLRGLR